MVEQPISYGHLDMYTFGEVLGSSPNLTLENLMGFSIISPLPAKPKGTLGLHSVRLTVHLSVRQFQFSGLFS